MRLVDGTTLYHGSYVPITSPDLGKCAPGKDFGRGFYLTTDRKQAEGFIRTSLKKARRIGAVSAEQSYGFVSTFVVRQPEELATFEFSTADEAWLKYVARNRRSELSNVLSRGKETLVDYADIIIGKVANDATNAVITAYLSGLYGNVATDSAARIAVGLLLPERLTDQLCFKTDKALSHLAFQEAQRHDV